MIDTENLGFHPKYVNPFYGGLMGLNFTRKEIVPNPIEFLKLVRALREELSNDDILILLNHNWRPSKVGAWIIGLCRIEELEKHLIEYLKNRPTYCEHVIINLTLFNSHSGNRALVNYVETQLTKILKLTIEGDEYKAGDMFDRNSILWAFNAIKYLDTINSTGNYKKLMNSKTWSSIKEKWLEISKSNSKAIGIYKMFCEAESKDLMFRDAIKIIKKEDNK